MDSLQSMRLFIRVVELGSFSAAARQANISQPAISKAIAALEKNIGVRLLERTTTSVTATEEGKRFYVRSKGVLDEYSDTVADVRGQAQRLAGVLAVNAPLGLGELRLNMLFLEFLAKYPEIEIDLFLSDRMVDLVEEGLDVVIRLGGQLPPNVVARTIASSPRVCVASPAYLSGKPKIRRPEDLAKHEHVRYAGSPHGNRMEFSRGVEKIIVEMQGRYRVSSGTAVLQCLLNGIGFALVPTWAVQDLIDNGVLVHLLPKWKMDSQLLHLLYPFRRYQPLRLRALLEFLTERIPESPGFQ